MKNTNFLNFAYGKRVAIFLALVMLLGSYATVPVSAGESTFRDIAEDDWFYSDVVYAYECELMNGVTANEFAPNAPLSRAMCATVLYRMAGEPDTAGISLPFSDVSDGEWYTEAVKWAYDGNIVKGHGDGTFAPKDNITRAQLATMLLRFANYGLFEIPMDRERTAFLDSDSIPQYSKGAVSVLYRAGIINGKPGNVFAPNADTTRAEAAAMIRRFSENSNIQDTALLDKYDLTLTLQVGMIAPYTSVFNDWLMGDEGEVCVIGFSGENAELIECVSVDIRSTSGLSVSECAIPFSANKYALTANCFDYLELSKHDFLCVIITITIEEEEETYTYYPTVETFTSEVIDS